MGAVTGAALHRITHSPAGIMVDRWSFSQVLDWALARRKMYASSMIPVLRIIEPLQARKLFLAHIAKVDTSSGSVPTEIIKFHLAPHMRKKFNKFMKEHGCTCVFQSLSSSLS